MVEIPSELSFKYDPERFEIIFDSNAMQFGLKSKNSEDNDVDELIEKIKNQKVKIFLGLQVII